MERGFQLMLRTFGDRPVRACYWEDSGGGFLACLQTEYDAAMRENRRPNLIGTPKGDAFMLDQELFGKIELACQGSDTADTRRLWQAAVRIFPIAA